MKNMKFLFEIILKIFTWAVILLLIYWLILKLTNHSPDVLDVLVILGVANISVTAGLFYKLGKMNATINFLNKQFSAFTRDFKQLKNDFYQK